MKRNVKFYWSISRAPRQWPWRHGGNRLRCLKNQAWLTPSPWSIGEWDGLCGVYGHTSSVTCFIILVWVSIYRVISIGFHRICPLVRFTYTLGRTITHNSEIKEFGIRKIRKLRTTEMLYKEETTVFYDALLCVRLVEVELTEWSRRLGHSQARGEKSPPNPGIHLPASGSGVVSALLFAKHVSTTSNLSGCE